MAADMIHTLAIHVAFHERLRFSAFDDADTPPFLITADTRSTSMS